MAWEGDSKGHREARLKSLRNKRSSMKYEPKEKLKSSTDKKTFSEEDMQNILKNIKLKVKAPYISGQVSTLGGKNRSSVVLTFSLDPKDSWQNGYLQNSRYANFSISYDGTIEMFSGTLKPYMRKSKFKNSQDVVDKLNKYIANFNQTQKNGYDRFFSYDDFKLIESNTNDNFHGENLQFIANKINSKYETKFKEINQMHKKKGYLTRNLQIERDRYIPYLMSELQAKSPDEYNIIKNLL